MAAFLAKSDLAGRALASMVLQSEFETAFQNADLTHAVMVCLGVAALFGKKFPHVLAGVAALGAGLWTFLTFQDWQEHGAPFGVHLPGAVWLPVAAGLIIAGAAAVLVRAVWGAALALLTASIAALLAVAVIRFANVHPEKFADDSSKLLAAYPLVATIALVVALAFSVLLVARLRNAMIVFASSHLASLFLLSGISYFVQRYGAHQKPFGLFDTFVQLLAKFHNGQCEELPHQCDCDARCGTEIATWIAMAWAIIVLQTFVPYCDRDEK